MSLSLLLGLSSSVFAGNLSDVTIESVTNFFRKLAFVGGSASLRFIEIFGSLTPGKKSIRTGNWQDASSLSASDKQWLHSLLPGKIVFDSNHSGRSRIYISEPDGSALQQLFESEAEDMYPEPAGNGEHIIFARAANMNRNATSDIYQAKLDGSPPQKLISNGSFPTYINNGSAVLFERDRSKVMHFDLTTGKEQEIFPNSLKDFHGFEISKPRMSADGSLLTFISDKGGRWNVWAVKLRQMEVSHVGPGCEPSPTADGAFVYWISKNSFFGRTGIARKDMKTGQTMWLSDLGPERGYKYFPSLVADDQVLLFSSGDGSEWSHTQARYQIYAKDLISGRCVKITHDQCSNRWARLLPKK